MFRKKEFAPNPAWVVRIGVRLAYIHASLSREKKRIRPMQFRRPHAQRNSIMSSLAATAAPNDDVTPFWKRYVDADQRIEMEIPAQWVNHPSQDYLFDLHAPDDPWTVLLLSYHRFDKLRFGERVNELLDEDGKRWTLQRKGSLIHNGLAAIEADFGLHSNGSSWLMRKLCVPHGDGLFALAFLTRLATWSRYGTIYRGVHRSFSMCSPAQPKTRLVPERAPQRIVHSEGPPLLL
jgi:hypothetical protein